MIINKIKELLTVTIIIFSLFIFANPTVDTSFFDTSSEKVLDLENDIEQENDEKEKNTFFFFNNFSLYSFYISSPKPLHNLHIHSYHSNSSLFKPPILIS